MPQFSPGLQATNMRAAVLHATAVAQERLALGVHAQKSSTRNTAICCTAQQGCFKYYLGGDPKIR